MRAKALGVALITMSLALNAWAQGGRLPALGEAQVWTMGQEQRLGESIKASLYASGRVWDDPVLEAYVQEVWRTLFEQARAQGLMPEDLAEGLPWVQLVIRDHTLNAFAMPGGVVGVHLGLLAASEQVDTLAAVLSHEMSHLSQRHIPRLLEAQNQMTPLAMGAMLVAILAASRSGSADLAQATIAGSQAMLSQAGINFTRTMEQEADRLGWQIYTAAGFAPEGFTALFEKLQSAASLNDDGSGAYLRTHPLSRERIAEVMAKQTFAEGRPKPRHTRLSALAPWMQARAMVAATQRAEDWRAWRTQAPSLGQPLSAPEEWVLYRAVQSAMRLGEVEWAWQALQHLDARPERDEAVRALLNADVLSLTLQLPPNMDKAQTTAARARAERALRSTWRGEWMAGARWYVKHGDADRVAGMLQAEVVQRPTDAAIWSLLADAREAQQQTLRMLRAQAEAQWVRGNAQGALDRLVAAKAWSAAHPNEDPIEAQVILTRERFMRRALAERAAAEASAR